VAQLPAVPMMHATQEVAVRSVATQPDWAANVLKPAPHAVQVCLLDHVADEPADWYVSKGQPEHIVEAPEAAKAAAVETPPLQSAHVEVADATARVAVFW